MQFNDIKKLAALMKEEGLTSLAYTVGDASIHMELGIAPTAPVCRQPEPEPVVVQTAAPIAPPAETSGNIYTVTSPMVGVFYTSPSADKKPYVSIGDRVKPGDVLCIIEAMKMMNEIAADRSGVITDMCVRNKQVVEYGHPLFRIALD